jgi:hypothetical protein
VASAASVQVQFAHGRGAGGVPGEQCVDGGGVEPVKQRRGEVVVGPWAPPRVEQALHGDIRHGAYQVGDRLAEGAQRLGGRGAVLHASGVEADHGQDRLAVHRLGQER